MHNQIERRDFLKSIGAAAGVGLVAGKAGAATTKPQKFLAGFAPSTDGTVDYYWKMMGICAKAGYHSIEVDNARLKLAEAYTNRASEFKDKMAELNLRLVGLNIGYPLADPNRIAEVKQSNTVMAKFLQQVGGAYIGPYARVEDDEEQMRRASRLLNEEGKRVLEENGIKLSYHTHSCHGFRRLMDMTNPAYIYLTPDLGWLAAVGGCDALDTCRSYRSRMLVVHLKDYDPNLQYELNGKPVKGAMVLPGKGNIDFPAVVDFLKETEWEGFFLGEHNGINRVVYPPTPESPEGFLEYKAYMIDTLHLNLALKV